ncbi:protein MODIFYING WALL LIGNIN-1-like isoform X1 [Vicia villosa]|uniref:protein MODIFYING WALL LIGNIN-1-like isoform X1 n=1 Tax=Vicia villosa TaxID=3911 RepID=UPI00273CEB79|nr:protein MODIFYING WALL LIGNIN-1-like isoform X1 [Vicia villosa]
MEIPPPRFNFTVIFLIIISLSFGLISFFLCIAAEIKRNKEEDLRWNGKLCYMETSKAFGLSIATLVSLFFAHIIGNYVLVKNSYSRWKSISKFKIPTSSKILYFISCRVSFGIVVILLIAATSMSRKQLYGKGWLNGECYIVKGGTYAGSAILILVTIGSLNGSAFAILKSSQAYQEWKIHTKWITLNIIRIFLC